MKFECNTCGATGLYKGFAERNGTAVICNRCHGKGHIEQGKVPFITRKPKPGVNQVFVDGGLWMLRNQNARTISISEFQTQVPS